MKTVEVHRAFQSRGKSAAGWCFLSALACRHLFSKHTQDINKMDFHRLTSNHAETIIFGKKFGIANAAGGSAGASVSTAVSFVDKYGSAMLPQALSYLVNVSPSQPAFVVITNKTASGFNVVLTPPAGVTLAAGTFDLCVLG
jgi:hypothetical protein